jgi:hypothetical protein
MDNGCKVPHQALATSERAMVQVNQAAATITQTDFNPTL